MDKVEVQGVLLFTLIPAIALIVGSIVAIFRVPGPRVSSAIQHFAAGVVFAAVSGEILPEVMREHRPIPALIGFTLGVITLLVMRHVAERIGSVGEDKTRSPTSLLITVALDIFVDGLLLGVGFAAGTEQGILLTIALTIEVLFLGVSTSAALAASGAGRSRQLGAAVGLGVLIIVGAVVGVSLLRGLSGGYLEAALAFGAAALLYLVTEELLVEAHEVPETPLSTAIFFLGFVVLFLIEMVATSPSNTGR